MHLGPIVGAVYTRPNNNKSDLFIHDVYYDDITSSSEKLRDMLIIVITKASVANEGPAGAIF